MFGNILVHTDLPLCQVSRNEEFFEQKKVDSVGASNCNNYGERYKSRWEKHKI